MNQPLFCPPNGWIKPIDSRNWHCVLLQRRGAKIYARFAGLVALAMQAAIEDAGAQPEMVDTSMHTRLPHRWEMLLKPVPSNSFSENTRDGDRHQCHHHDAAYRYTIHPTINLDEADPE